MWVYMLATCSEKRAAERERAEGKEEQQGQGQAKEEGRKDGRSKGRTGAACCCESKDAASATPHRWREDGSQLPVSNRAMAALAGPAPSLAHSKETCWAADPRGTCRTLLGRGVLAPGEADHLGTASSRVDSAGARVLAVCLASASPGILASSVRKEEEADARDSRGSRQRRPLSEPTPLLLSGASHADLSSPRDNVTGMTTTPSRPPRSSASARSASSRTAAWSWTSCWTCRTRTS